MTGSSRHVGFTINMDTVDLFADDRNTQLAIFNSKVFSPGTSGVDAFSFTWTGQNNWLCPPNSLVLRVLEKVRTYMATATLMFLGGKVLIFGLPCAQRVSRGTAIVKDICRFPAVYIRGRRRHCIQHLAIHHHSGLVRCV